MKSLTFIKNVLFWSEIIEVIAKKLKWSPKMDNTFYLKLLAEVYQDCLLEDGVQRHLLPGQQRIASPTLRKAIVTGGSFLIRTGEALKGIGVPDETSPFSSNGPSASIVNNASVDV